MISPKSKRPYIFTNISSCLRVILCTSVIILLTVITLTGCTGNQDNILPFRGWNTRPYRMGF